MSYTCKTKGIEVSCSLALAYLRATVGAEAAEAAAAEVTITDGRPAWESGTTIRLRRDLRDLRGLDREAQLHRIGEVGLSELDRLGRCLAIA